MTWIVKKWVIEKHPEKDHKLGKIVVETDKAFQFETESEELVWYPKGWVMNTDLSDVQFTGPQKKLPDTRNALPATDDLREIKKLLADIRDTLDDHTSKLNTLMPKEKKKKEGE